MGRACTSGIATMRGILLLATLTASAFGADGLRFEAVLEAEGDVQAPAAEAGLLAEVVVSPGDQVAAGDLVARLDDEAAQAAVARARAELQIATVTAEADVAVRIAQKEREVAAAELARSERAVSNVERAISQSKLDQLQLDVDKATLKVEEAELAIKINELTRDLKKEELRVAQKALDNRSVVAAFDGMVVEVARDVGDWVQPGDPIARIVRTYRLRAEAVIPSAQAAATLVGREVDVLVDGNAGPVARGRVVFVSPIVDRFNDEVRCQAEIDNSAGRLRAGQRVVLSVRQHESP